MMFKNCYITVWGIRKLPTDGDDSPHLMTIFLVQESCYNAVEDNSREKKTITILSIQCNGREWKA